MDVPLRTKHMKEIIIFQIKGCSWYMEQMIAMIWPKSETKWHLITKYCVDAQTWIASFSEAGFGSASK